MICIFFYNKGQIKSVFSVLEPGEIIRTVVMGWDVGWVCGGGGGGSGEWWWDRNVIALHAQPSEVYGQYIRMEEVTSN